MSWYDPTSWDWGDVKNFGKGALTGATLGAQTGSPWGIAAGAVGGGVANAAMGGGLTGGGGGGSSGSAGGIQPKPVQYDYAQQQYKNILGQAAPTVTATQLSPVQMDQSRAGVLGVANRLQGIASGTQQGAGEMAVNAQLGRAAAAQTALARMAHGQNAALAARNAARNTADLGLAGAGQAGQARIQDQAQANSMLGSLYGNLYGQDAGVAAQNAQLGQAANLANQQAAMQTQAQRIQALGSMLGWDQATINGQIAAANAAVQQQMANQHEPNFLANLLQGGGQLAQTLPSLGLGGGAGGTASAVGGINSGPITLPSQVG